MTMQITMIMIIVVFNFKNELSIHHAIIQQSLNVINSSQNEHIFGVTMG